MVAQFSVGRILRFIHILILFDLPARKSLGMLQSKLSLRPQYPSGKRRLWVITTIQTQIRKCLKKHGMTRTSRNTLARWVSCCIRSRQNRATQEIPGGWNSQNTLPSASVFPPAHCNCNRYNFFFLPRHKRHQIFFVFKNIIILYEQMVISKVNFDFLDGPRKKKLDQTVISYVSYVQTRSVVTTMLNIWRSPECCL